MHSTLRTLFVRRNALESGFQRKYGEYLLSAWLVPLSVIDAFQQDASSLTLRSSRNYGMHIHLGRSKRDSAKIKASPLFVKIAESASTATFFNQVCYPGHNIAYPRSTRAYQEWSILGSQIVETTSTIMAAERDAFEELRAEVSVFTLSAIVVYSQKTQVNAYSGPIWRNARILDELDVTLAFANLATEMQFVRPTITAE